MSDILNRFLCHKCHNDIRTSVSNCNTMKVKMFLLVESFAYWQLTQLYELWSSGWDVVIVGGTSLKRISQVQILPHKYNNGYSGYSDNSASTGCELINCCTLQVCDHLFEVGMSFLT